MCGEDRIRKRETASVGSHSYVNHPIRSQISERGGIERDRLYNVTAQIRYRYRLQRIADENGVVLRTALIRQVHGYGRAGDGLQSRQKPVVDDVVSKGQVASSARKAARTRSRGAAEVDEGFSRIDRVDDRQCRGRGARLRQGAYATPKLIPRLSLRLSRHKTRIKALWPACRFRSGESTARYDSPSQRALRVRMLSS